MIQELGFFELMTSESFTSSSVGEFETEMNCRVLEVSENNLPTENENVIDAGNVILVEGRYEVLHYQVDNRFVFVREIGPAPTPQTNIGQNLRILNVLHPFIAIAALIWVIVATASGLFALYVSASIA